MNILIMAPDKATGVSYHRLVVPFNRIGLSGHNVCREVHLDHEAKNRKEIIKSLEQFDVCVFNRNISPAMNYKPAFKTLKAAGVKIIVDLDDYWEVDRDHILKNFEKATNYSLLIQHQVMDADMVWCTHKQLAQAVERELGVKKRKIKVIPNAIDPLQPQFKHEADYDYNSLFWQGSPTHFHDLRLLSTPVNETGIPITIAGYIKDDPEWERMVGLFDNKTLAGTLDVFEYVRHYDKSGISLIPLRDTKFNRMKSELKMIEAGYFKKAVIVSPIYPYTRLGIDEKNCLFATDWKTEIQRLIASPEMQDELRGNLYNDIMDTRLIDTVNEKRLNAIEELCYQKI